LTAADVTLDVKDGKNTGFAVVELHSVEEKIKALEYDRKSMHTRWIGVN